MPVSTEMLKIIRVFLVGLWFFAGSGMLLVFYLFRPFHVKNGLLWGTFITPLARKILNYKFEFRNQNKIFENHPCICIGNHQHALDLIAFGETLSVPVTSLGKKELLWVPIFGWTYWLAGQILINRQHKGKAMNTMDYAKEVIERTNASIWIFPEGTRSPDGKMGPLKKGAFYLAIQTQRPLLPHVANTFHKSLDFNKWNSGTLIIEVLDPIPTKGLTVDDIDALIEKTRNIMLACNERLDKELAARKN